MIRTDEEIEQERQHEEHRALVDRIDKLERLLEAHAANATKDREKLNDLMTIRASGQGVFWVLSMLAGVGFALYSDRIKSLLTAFFRPDIRP